MWNGSAVYGSLPVSIAYMLTPLKWNTLELLYDRAAGAYKWYLPITRVRPIIIDVTTGQVSLSGWDLELGFRLWWTLGRHIVTSNKAAGISLCCFIGRPSLKVETWSGSIEGLPPPPSPSVALCCCLPFIHQYSMEWSSLSMEYFVAWEMKIWLSYSLATQLILSFAYLFFFLSQDPLCIRYLLPVSNTI